MKRNVMPTGTRTGGANTDAVAEVTCPKCKAAPGERCRTPKGRLTDPPHGERVAAFLLLPGAAATCTLTARAPAAPKPWGPA